MNNGTWLTEGIRVCTFLTLEIAHELELTILHAMIDPLEPLRLRTGDVIVSESFEDLVKLAVDARSNNTPRKKTSWIKRASGAWEALRCEEDFL